MDTVGGWMDDRWTEERTNGWMEEEGRMSGQMGKWMTFSLAPHSNPIYTRTS